MNGKVDEEEVWPSIENRGKQSPVQSAHCGAPRLEPQPLVKLNQNDFDAIRTWLVGPHINQEGHAVHHGSEELVSYMTK